MNRDERTPTPELDPLFEAAKVVAPIATTARARALARARATAARPLALAARDARQARMPRWRFAMALALLLVFGATGAVAAFLQHRSATLARAVAPPAPEDRPLVRPAISHPPALEPAPLPAPADQSRPPRGHATRARGSSTVELALVQRAQMAYADGNLRVALDLLASHRRRFPNGRFAEEREALRVRSLARCGRETEARRALQAFAERFPNSVLLPHLREALTQPHAQP